MGREPDRTRLQVDPRRGKVAAPCALIHPRRRSSEAVQKIRIVEDDHEELGESAQAQRLRFPGAAGIDLPEGLALRRGPDFADVGAGMVGAWGLARFDVLTISKGRSLPPSSGARKPAPRTLGNGIVSIAAGNSRKVTALVVSRGLRTPGSVGDSDLDSFGSPSSGPTYFEVIMLWRAA